MNKLLITATLAAITLPSAAFAQAGDSDFSIGASVTGSTNYEWRGVSQSNNHAAVFAAVNVGYKGFYAGAGTENVDFANIKQEYDLWGGYVLPLGKIAKLDVGVVRYGYVNARTRIDTLEGKVGLSGSIGKLGLSATAYHTGNYFGSRRAATYLVAGANYGVTDKLRLSGEFGHQKVNGNFSYNTWNLGASYEVIKGGTIDVRYHDTDDDGRLFGRLGRARLVGSFTLAF